MTGPLRGQTNKADLHPILSPVVPNPHQPPRLGWAELHFDVTWADPLLPTILIPQKACWIDQIEPPNLEMATGLEAEDSEFRQP